MLVLLFGFGFEFGVLFRIGLSLVGLDWIGWRREKGRGKRRGMVQRGYSTLCSGGFFFPFVVCCLVTLCPVPSLSLSFPLHARSHDQTTKFSFLFHSLSFSENLER